MVLTKKVSMIAKFDMKIKADPYWVDHKWFCIRCSKLWTLAVNMSEPKDREKLNFYYSAMTIHTLQNVADDHNHEIIHKEKLRRGF